MAEMSDCILYNCDAICQDNCLDCNVFGEVDEYTMYKLGHLSGFYAVCCPACKRMKYKVTNEDMIQGDCLNCDKRLDKRGE